MGCLGNAEGAGIGKRGASLGLANLLREANFSLVPLILFASRRLGVLSALDGTRRVFGVDCGRKSSSGKPNVWPFGTRSEASAKLVVRLCEPSSTFFLGEEVSCLVGISFGRESFWRKKSRGVSGRLARSPSNDLLCASSVEERPLGEEATERREVSIRSAPVRVGDDSLSRDVALRFPKGDVGLVNSNRDMACVLTTNDAVSLCNFRRECSVMSKKADEQNPLVHVSASLTSIVQTTAHTNTVVSVIAWKLELQAFRSHQGGRSSSGVFFSTH